MKKKIGKKFMTCDEFDMYIQLLNSEDIESKKLGLALFKQSKTYKHYKFSPISKFRHHRCLRAFSLQDEICDIEFEIENNFCKDFKMRINRPALLRWMIRHTLKTTKR